MEMETTKTKSKIVVMSSFEFFIAVSFLAWLLVLVMHSRENTDFVETEK